MRTVLAALPFLALGCVDATADRSEVRGTSSLGVPSSGQSLSIDSLAFTPDGSLLISGESDGVAKLRDARTGKEVANLGENSGSRIALSPDGKTVAGTGHRAGDAAEVTLWDLRTRTARIRLKWNGPAWASAHHVYCLAFSPDGKLLATGCGGWQDKGDTTNQPVDVKVWQTATGNEIATLHGHSSFVNSLAFSPDGKTLVSAGWRSPIRLWDTAIWKQRAVLELDSSSVNKIAFSADGKILASCGHGLHGEDVPPEKRDFSKMYFFSGITFWEMPKGRNLAAIRDDYHTGMCGLAFSPNGQTLAVGGGRDKLVHLFDVATRESRATMDGHTGFVSTVVFSPDGKTLASSGADGTVRLWPVLAASHRPLR